ncbi:MAG: tetratricopeptide repeat protein [Thermodesulfobacteriota bacterium]
MKKCLSGLTIFLALTAPLWAGTAEKVREATERAAHDYMQHGLIQASEGRSESAIKSFQKAVNLMPQSAEAHSLLGSALARAGKYREAEEELRKAVSLKPDYGEGYYYLGLFLQERGKEAEAQEAFRKAKQYQR